MTENQLLSLKHLLLLYLGFAVVYISGLFIPLMENDSAQHASMAMRMAINNDFLHIFKGENPYLDKPHMHFWLAAISMKFFGINAVAYRIPALLCLALGALSTKKLTELLYSNKNLGSVASLIFLSAQTIILSAHDVRTDAVLTGFIIFSVWQLVKFIKTQKISAALLGGLGTAMAFSSKGQMAVLIIGSCILAYVVYSREWKSLFTLKVLTAALAFAIGILPILYAYFVQFGAEGIRFILFNQSFNRLTGNGFKETSPDYFFFFHTLLWVFLPFSLLFYLGVFERSRFFIKNKFTKFSGVEFLSLGGFWFVILLFSFSKFKLPHYLNGLIAVLSIFTAGYYYHLVKTHQPKKVKILYYIQLVVISLAIVGVAALAWFFASIPNIPMYIVTVASFVFLLLKMTSRENIFTKYLFISLWFAVSVNLFLNTQFYPVLTQYQGGLRLAKFVNQRSIQKDKIICPSGYETWAFDFYTQRNTPRIPIEEVQPKDILLVKQEDLGKIKHPYRIIHAENQYHITRLSIKFLNPKTRPDQLSKMYLVEIQP